MRRATMNATGVACCAAVVAAMGCGEGGLYGDDIPDRIVVLYPVGGEELTAGGPVEVRWTSLGVEGNVEIHLSTDGGQAYDVLLGTAPASSGRFVWQYPNENSSSCRVRIRLQGAEQPFDSSANDFTVLPFFTRIETSMLRQEYGALAWGDCDQDGDYDLVSSTDEQTVLYENDGAGTFSDGGENLFGFDLSAVAWGDFDNDDWIDLVIGGQYYEGGYHTESRLYYGTKYTGLVEATTQTIAGVSLGCYAWGDYDNDGDLDLAFSGAKKAGVFENDGGSFAEVGTDLPPLHGWRSAVGWGDYDNDGDLDLAIAGENDSDQALARIYRNDGGTFIDAQAGLSPATWCWLAWGDYDADGDLDLAVTGYSTGGTDHDNPATRIYRNDGGSFTDILAGLPGTSAGSLAWGDFDNDGDLDLALAGSSTTAVYRNDGGGTFVDLNGGFRRVSLAALAWADYDLDGDLDLVVAGFAYDTCLYRNQVHVANSLPSAPDALAATPGGGDVTFSWNEATDNETPSAGLTYNLRVGRDPGHGSVVSGMSLDSGFRLVPQMGNAQHNRTWTVKGLTPDVYYWSVQAVDGAFAGSPWADEQTLVIGPLTTASYTGMWPMSGPDTGGTKVRVTGTGTSESFYHAQVLFDGVAAERTGSSWSASNGGTGEIRVLAPAHAAGTVAVTVEYLDGQIVAVPGSYLYYDGSQPTLHIDVPNGGEVWTGGDDRDIIWSSSRVTGLVNIEYTTDSAASPVQWQSVVTSIEDSGRFTWTVPSGYSDRCRVRIAEIGTGVSDISDMDFLLRPLVSLAETSVTLPAVDSAAWGDYDGDGDLDLALAGGAGGSYACQVHTNTLGAFADSGVSMTGVGHGPALAWGDYDADGLLDLVVSGQDNSYGYCTKSYKSTGATLAESSLALINMRSGRLAWGDYDNDGDLDLLICGSTWPSIFGGQFEVSAMQRNGASGFELVNAGLTGVRYCGVAWGDYDNDGDLDVALCGETEDDWSYFSAIYRNDNAVFTDIGAGLTQFRESSLAWADYDNDGDLDLAVAGRAESGGGAVVIYDNQAGTFSDIGADIEGRRECDLAWGDYDNDGDYDLVVTGYADSGPIRYRTDLYRNDGGEMVAVTSDLQGLRDSRVAWGDYDNDGDLDLVLAGQDITCMCFLYDNDCTTPNTRPAPPADLAVTFEAGGVTFSWSESSDVETPAPTLTYNLRVGSSPGSDDVMPGMSIIGGVHDGRRLIPAMGNVQHNTSWTVKGLAADTYYWSVQAVDTAFAGSAWAAEESVGVGVPAITTHPANETVTEGQTATFTVAATGSGLTYQWQESTDGGSTWTDVAGATSDTYSFTAQVADDGAQFVCIVTNAGGSVTSNAATLTVQPLSLFTDFGQTLGASNTQAVALGDVDGDGDLDIVAGNSNPHANRLYLNNGTADPFSGVTGSDITTDAHDTISVALGDVDGDGDLDLVAGNNNQTNRLYLNNGTANPFGGVTGSDVTTDAHSTISVALGDVDGDGDLDLVAGNLTQTNRLYLNNGTADPFGGVTGSDITTDAHQTQQVALGDVDGDGDLDLVAGNWSGETNRLYLNNGTADPFAAVAGSDITADAHETYSVALGDVDGDGDLDVAAGTWSGQANRVYRNNSPVPNTPPSAPGGLSANVSGSDVTFSWNAASDNETLTPVLTYNLRVGTGPGLADVMPAHAVIGGATDGERMVPVMGNVQQNTSWTVKGFAGGTYYWSVQTVDSGLAGSAWAAEKTFMLGPLFSDSLPTFGSSDTIAMAMGDVDSDGDLDLIAGNAGAQPNQVWKNDGSGQFTGVAFGAGSSAVALGDVDSDGDLDVVVGHYPGANRVWMNDGTGSLAVSPQMLGGGDTTAVTLGDVDLDGDLDLVAGNNAQPDLVWLNDGAGTFTDSGQVLGGSSTQFIALGDVDGDGDLDLVVGNSGPQANLVWKNNGAGDFTDTGQSLGVSNTMDVVLGDIDGDGDLDFVDGNWNQPNQVWKNDGAGIFTLGQALGGSRTIDVALGDVDGDGDLDIVAVNNDNTPNRVWLGDGAGSFTDSGLVLGSGWSSALELGDVDSDGDLDFVSGNYSNQPNRVWVNNGAANTRPSAPAGLASNASGSDVTFSWNAASDNETLTPTLTYNLRVGTSPGDDDVMPAHAVIGGATDGERIVPAMGNVQQNLSWTLKGLAAGTYYWSVQTVDSGLAGSAWAGVEMVLPAYKIIDLTTGAVTDTGSVPDLESNVDYKTTKLVLKRIEAGSFTMGDEVNVAVYLDEEPEHTVNITQPFYMGVFEVTQRQWTELMGAWAFYFGPSDVLPTESVSWDDCQSYLTQLSTTTGATFRLPTEAEWEYVCKAGTSTNWSNGDTEDGAWMWYNSNSVNQAHEVATTTSKPNPWGLCDMHGNVGEWCEDWAGAYSSETVSDPTGPGSGTFRVVRGGAYHSSASDCRSSVRRLDHVQTASVAFTGLRVVLAP